MELAGAAGLTALACAGRGRIRTRTDIQVAGETPFSAQPITLNGGGAALELLYGYTYIGDVLAPRRVGARIRYAFG